MEELANRTSHRLSVGLTSALIVIFSVWWAVAFALAPFSPVHMVSASALGLFMVIGFTKRLQAAPRVVILRARSFRVGYTLGENAFEISTLREAVFFEAPWPYRQRAPTDAARLAYLNLLGGGTKKLGVLDAPVAERLIEALANEGCDVKVFQRGVASSKLLGAGHQPAS